MGLIASQFEERPLLRETQGFAKWTIKDVDGLRKRFVEQVRGFSMVKAQFESLISPKRALHDDVSLSAIFKVLDSDGDGRIDGLAFLAGITLCCTGSFEEKVKFCFELFDFNLNAQLSQSEMVMMMQCSIGGMLAMTGCQDDGLSMDVFERLCQDALKQHDSDASGNISYTEFTAWARSNREIMSCVEKLNKISGDAVTNAHDAAGDSDEEIQSDEDPFMTAELSLSAFAREGAHSGVRRASSLAWKGVLVEPTNWPFRAGKDHQHGSTESNLRLDHVHGFRGQDCRSNVKFVDLSGPSSTGTSSSSSSSSSGGDTTVPAAGLHTGVVFPAATLVVVQSTCGADVRQSFYEGHSDDVISLTVHPTRTLVASGQLGSVPEIHIWETATQRSVQILQGFHKYGVGLLRFSNRGDLIVSTGYDHSHSIAIHRWAQGELVASGRGNGSPQPLDVAFNGDDSEVCVVGHRYIHFFAISSRALRDTPAELQGLVRSQTFTCVQYLANDAIVATQTGQIVRFRGNVAMRVVEVNVGDPVQSMCLIDGGESGIATAGRDGLIHQWDSTLKQVGYPIDVAERVEAGKARVHVPELQSVDMVDGLVLAGTRSGQILLSKLAKNLSAESDIQILASSHYEGELWGLAVHPSLKVYVTVGEDRTLRVWDFYERTLLTTRIFPTAHGACRAACFSPSGHHLAVGLCGPVVVLDAYTLEVVCWWKHTDSAVQDLAYSPDGHYLAVASADHNVYLYTVECVDRIVERQQSELHGVGSGGTTAVSAHDPPTVRNRHRMHRQASWASGGVLHMSLAGAGSTGSPSGDGAGRLRYLRHAVCRGHRLPVLRIDFGQGSEHFQTTAGGDSGPARELLHWHVSGMQVRQLMPLRHVVFDPWSCAHGFQVQGMSQHPTRAEVTAMHGVGDVGVLASGDAEGHVWLNRFPCISSQCLSKQYQGHSWRGGGISNLKFVCKQAGLVSIGRRDRCIFQWRHEFEDLTSDEEADCEDVFDAILGHHSPRSSTSIKLQDLLGALTDPSMHAKLVNEYSDHSPLIRVLIDADLGHIAQACAQLNSRNNIHRKDWEHFLEILEAKYSPIKEMYEKELVAMEISQETWLLKAQTSDAKSDANTSWLGSIVEPSGYKMDPDTLNTADIDLELYWAIGYRGRDCRDNLFYAAGGQIVYPTVSLGVVYDKSTDKQYIYTGDGVQTNDVASIAMHPCGKLVAMGELLDEPKVMVWDVDSRETKAILNGFHRNGVVRMAFSPSGDLLATVGLDDNHSIALYDWAKGSLLATAPVDKALVLSLAFVEDPVHGWQLVTAGQSIRFWTLTGQMLHCQRGVWGTGASPETIVSLASVGQYLVSSTLDGSLIIWKGHRIHCRVEDSCNPHRHLYRGMQDSPVSASRSGGLRSVGLNMENRSAINTLCVFSSEAGQRDPSTSREVVPLRMLSGDSRGLLVLWACRNDKSGLSLHPLLTVSVANAELAPPLGFLRRVVPPWAATQVRGIDATPDGERYRRGHGREEDARLLNLRPMMASIRSLSYRDGFVLVGTQCNAIYELRLDTIRDSLMDQRWIRACAPRRLGDRRSDHTVSDLESDESAVRRMTHFESEETSIEDCHPEALSLQTLLALSEREDSHTDGWKEALRTFDRLERSEDIEADPPTIPGDDVDLTVGDIVEIRRVDLEEDGDWDHRKGIIVSFDGQDATVDLLPHTQPFQSAEDQLGDDCFEQVSVGVGELSARPMTLYGFYEFLRTLYPVVRERYQPKFIQVEVSSSGAGSLCEGIGYDELMLELNYLQSCINQWVVHPSMTREIRSLATMVELTEEQLTRLYDLKNTALATGMKPTDRLVHAASLRLSREEFMSQLDPRMLPELSQPSWRTAGLTRSIRSPTSDASCTLGLVALGLKSGLCVPWIQSLDDTGDVVATCHLTTHSHGSLWALAAHPLAQAFVMGGDDGVVRLYRTGQKRHVMDHSIGQRVRALDYKPNQDKQAATISERLAVGTANGEIIVLNGLLQPTGIVLRGPTQCVLDLKYSPDGRRLVATSQDCRIYIWDITGGESSVDSLSRSASGRYYNPEAASEHYQSLDACSVEHTAPVLHVEWGTFPPHLLSGNSHWDVLITVSDAHEIRYWQFKDANTRRTTAIASARRRGSDLRSPSLADTEALTFKDAFELVPSASIVRDVEWHTWTSTVGWSVQGLWSGADHDGNLSERVRSVDRCHTWKSVPVLATGDDQGAIKLYNYPCVSTETAAKKYLAHTSKISKVRFLRKDEFLVSVGQSEQCVIIWQTDCVEESREREAAGVTDIASHGTVVHSIEPNDHMAQPGRRRKRSPLLAIKPWMSEIREPSDYREPPKDVNPESKGPDTDLVLSHVYGFSSQDTKSNLQYTATADRVVYFSGVVGIVMDLPRRQQVFNQDHEGCEILSMAVHPQKHLVATGDRASKPKIVIWDDNSGSTLRILKGSHQQGVIHLRFNASGNLLVSVGSDADHSIAVHRVSDGTLISSGKGDRSHISDLAVLGDLDMVTVGPSIVKFYNIVEGELQSKKGIFSKQMSGRGCVCASYLGVTGDCVTGQMDGSLFLWKGRVTAKLTRVHTKRVNSLMAVTGAGGSTGGVVSGGDDGVVILWDENLSVYWSYDLATARVRNSLSLSTDCRVRSVCVLHDKVLVGTQGSEIYEIDRAIASDTQGHIKKHMEGHSEGEAWGLAVHPIVQHFATGGDDGYVRVWDALTRQVISRVHFEGRVRALCWSPTGEHLAVGLHTGMLCVIDSATLHERSKSSPHESSASSKGYFTVPVAHDFISVITYSPDGEWLAVGAHDSCIYLLKTSSYSRHSILRGHSRGVTHIDFSANNAFLQSNSDAYELFFWNIRKDERISASDARDIKWNSFTCVLGWPTAGIWRTQHLSPCSNTDGDEGEVFVPDLSTVDKSTSGQSVAVGDDEGRIRLFPFPCPSSKKTSGFQQIHGHASHVTQVKFTKASRFLISAGGSDNNMLQFTYRTKSH